MHSLGWDVDAFGRMQPSIGFNKSEFNKSSIPEGPMKGIKSRIIRLGPTGNEHAASIATERLLSLTG
jgi:hypothetical protein